MKLRVAEAIAECCRWPGNPAQLGQGGGVKPLINYLRSTHLELRRAAAKALHQVSSDRENCLILHRHGAVMVPTLIYFLKQTLGYFSIYLYISHFIFKVIAETSWLW